MVLTTKMPEVSTVSNPSSESSHCLGSADQIPLGEGRLFRVDHLAVAVFRNRRGQLFATQADCPHRAGPLSDGLIGDTTLICPLHNFRFNLENGAPLGNDCPSLKTCRVALNDAGEIVVDTRA